MHNIIMEVYDENVDKRKIQEQWDNYAVTENRQEGCSGIYPIRWIDNKIYVSQEEAEFAIKDLDNGWYDCLAVKFYDRKASESTYTKAYQNMLKTQGLYKEAYYNVTDKAREEFFSCKSEYVGCKECGSRLKRALLKQAKCPLCGASLLSNTMQNRINGAKKRLENINEKCDKQYKRECDRIKPDKASIKWLLKVEYHT